MLDNVIDKTVNASLIIIRLVLLGSNLLIPSLADNIILVWFIYPLALTLSTSKLDSSIRIFTVLNFALVCCYS